ncbi:MAG: hypothetical protein FIA95_14320, partial [Gemmatimonadetes bacterium]|nr:hypothetical protein [Gemmatimonadota bacterium]
MAVGAAAARRRAGPAGAAAGSAWAVAACVLSVVPAPLAGQATVRSARLVADLTAAVGDAAVRVEYALSGVGAGDSVAVTLLD